MVDVDINSAQLILNLEMLRCNKFLLGVIQWSIATEFAETTTGKKIQVFEPTLACMLVAYALTPLGLCLICFLSFFLYLHRAFQKKHANFVWPIPTKF